jgi:hypothetical protein
MLCSLLYRLAEALDDRVTAEYCNRVDGIAQALIAVERYAS